METKRRTLKISNENQARRLAYSACNNDEYDMNDIIKNLKQYRKGKEHSNERSIKKQGENNKKPLSLSMYRSKTNNKDSGFGKRQFLFNEKKRCESVIKPQYPPAKELLSKIYCGNIFGNNVKVNVNMDQPLTHPEILRHTNDKPYISKLLSRGYNGIKNDNAYRHKRYSSNSGFKGNEGKLILTQDLSNNYIQEIDKSKLVVELKDYSLNKQKNKNSKIINNEVQHCIDYDSSLNQRKLTTIFDIHEEQTVEDLHDYFVDFYQKAKLALKKIEKNTSKRNGESLDDEDKSIISISDDKEDCL